MRTRFALVLAALALVAAALVYATARDGFLLHEWMRTLAPGWRPMAALPAFVRFNLPDALWQYAFCVCMLGVWRTAGRSARTWIFVALPIAIGLGSELGQAAGVVEGVFDPIDAATMFFAVVAAVLTVGLPAADHRARGLLRGGGPT